MDFRETLKAEVDKAQRALTEAKIRYETLASTLAKFDATAPKNGHSSTVAISPVAASTSPSPIQDQDDDSVNVSAEVRKILIDNRGSGITSRDLMDALKAKGLDVADTYVYSLISRLRQKNRVETRSNKHYATDAILHVGEENAKVLQ